MSSALLSAAPGKATFDALGTTAVLLVEDHAQLDQAERMLRCELAAIDRAASRFRPDSELVRLSRNAGVWNQVSPVLAGALAAALRAARATRGMVDPTVGRAMIGLGYDRDFARLLDSNHSSGGGFSGGQVPLIPVPGWQRVELDLEGCRVRLPRGVELDLGATAKAYAADRAAQLISDELGCGTLVSLGGDIAVAGPAPTGGWRVSIGDDHAGSPRSDDAQITLTCGGLATSGTTRRTWAMAGRRVHHIIDPRTGDCAGSYWRTATVAAASCVDANAASTAAIVQGRAALAWLTRLRLPARLVHASGLAAITPNWPTIPFYEPEVDHRFVQVDRDSSYVRQAQRRIA